MTDCGGGELDGPLSLGLGLGLGVAEGVGDGESSVVSSCVGPGELCRAVGVAVGAPPAFPPSSARFSSA